MKDNIVKVDRPGFIIDMDNPTKLPTCDEHLIRSTYLNVQTWVGAIPTECPDNKVLFWYKDSEKREGDESGRLYSRFCFYQIAPF